MKEGQAQTSKKGNLASRHMKLIWNLDVGIRNSHIGG